jgi:hypothetical protein
MVRADRRLRRCDHRARQKFISNRLPGHQGLRELCVVMRTWSCSNYLEYQLVGEPWDMSATKKSGRHQRGSRGHRNDRRGARQAASAG